MMQPQSPVSRIGGASDESGDPILVDMYAKIRAKRGYILNIHQVVGFSPKMLRAQATYAHSMREESVLPRDLQELLIIRIAQLHKSEYEQTVHRPIALDCGATLDQINALTDWRNAKVFNDRERAALAFVDQAAANGDVDDKTFEATSAVFSKQEIVELAVLVSWYVGNAHFVRTLRIAPQVDPTQKK